LRNDSTTEIPDQLHDHDAVVDNLMCLACGYNLRGLSRKSHCPECGSKIVNTIIARQGMTKREFAALAFRISALWYLLKTIADLSEILRFSSGQWSFTAFLWLVILGVMGLLFVVWWKADLLAQRAIRTDGPLSLSGHLISHQLMAVALGIIGVLYIIYGITGSAWAMMQIIMDLNNAMHGYSIVNAALNLVIGCVLLLGATRIANAVLWLRTVGTKREDQRA
jgi:predicted RNA-binding Zn-ribbon protein involved in translation (DUF1610 family)